MNKQINLNIDGIPITVPEGTTIMQAADSVGVHIPRLCYHSKLSLYGGCRICVVEVEGMKVYPASCATAVSEGMVVKTHSKDILKARKEILELIFCNHPQGCQLCERNGECELQGLAETLGLKEVPFQGDHKTYPKDTSSLSVVRNPEKCILCGRCVRICSEVQGVNALTFAFRGFKTNVVPAYGMGLGESTCINCGQCTLVCPTGAIIEKDSIEDVWKNIHDPEMTVVAQIAPAVRVAIGEEFGNEPGKDMTYETVTALRMLGVKVIFDTQFSADLTIMEEGYELINRITNKGKLPMITSCSPGWIKYCESFYPEFLENISTCKSPQQMMGALIKTYYAKKKGIDPSKIYSVSIMPCTAKKYESARPEMNSSGYRDVDAVLTTRELAEMIKQAGIQLNSLKKGEFDSPMGESTGAAVIFGATGGVMEAALRTAYEVLTGKELAKVDFNNIRGLEGIKEATISINNMDVNVAIVNGLANVSKLLNDIKEGKKQYHFIEVMTCPGGCLGGGGQPYPKGKSETLDKTIYEKRAKGIYGIDAGKGVRKSHENPDIKIIYKEFLEKPLGHMSHKLLHTHYEKRSPKGIPSKTKETVNVFEK
jgi:iron-only hydrogenase group A